jgi:hypothetical protein
MVVVIAVAAVAVLAAVVVLALGRGGELAEVRPDHPPLRLPTGRPLVGTDVALLRLPKGLWGYHVGTTDDALHRMAYALTERDALVALLQRRLAEFQQESETDDGEPGGPWLAAPAEYGAGHSTGHSTGHSVEAGPWTAPPGFGHADDHSVQGDGGGFTQDYGPRPLWEGPYAPRHEASGETVLPEDR